MKKFLKNNFWLRIMFVIIWSSLFFGGWTRIQLSLGMAYAGALVALLVVSGLVALLICFVCSKFKAFQEQAEEQ